jgi:hypothetical protein
MKPKLIRCVAILVLALCVTLLMAHPFRVRAMDFSALVSTGKTIERWVVGGGGGTSQGSSGFFLNGTVGQPDVGQSNSAGFTLDGGFWAGGAMPSSVFLPLIQR